MSELKDKTAKGLLWGAMNNGAMQILNAVFGIVLGRLLSLSDYGLVGMLAIFTAVASALQESGFTSALVNKQDAADRDFNAVFWFSLLMGTGLYFVLFLCAPLIASLFPPARYHCVVEGCFPCDSALGNRHCASGVYVQAPDGERNNGYSHLGSAHFRPCRHYDGAIGKGLLEFGLAAAAVCFDYEFR